MSHAHEHSSHQHSQISQHSKHVQHDEHSAPDKHAGHSVSMFRDKFWGSVLLTIPTVVWSPMVQDWLGFTAPAFPGSRFVPAVFGSILFLYGGLVFLRGAVQEIRDRLPGMMTLIALAGTGLPALKASRTDVVSVLHSE